MLVEGGREGRGVEHRWQQVQAEVPSAADQGLC